MGGGFLSMYRPERQKSFFGVNVGVELSVGFLSRQKQKRGDYYFRPARFEQL